MGSGEFLFLMEHQIPWAELFEYVVGLYIIYAWTEQSKLTLSAQVERRFSETPETRISRDFTPK